MSSNQDFLVNIEKTISYLKTKKKILFLTTSNRWSGEHGGENAKSTQLAEKIKFLIENNSLENLQSSNYKLQSEEKSVRSSVYSHQSRENLQSTDFNLQSEENVQSTVTILDVPKLVIYPCEGNVSTGKGNSCGLLDAMLKNPEFNPTGFHRCWASLNNPDDELWKISKELFASDCVLIFGSVRWGQMNSHYQKLIERLTWIENRHSTLGEENIVKNIDAGLIAFGQNWNGENVVKTQKAVLEYFGFKTPDELFWNWQFLENPEDESKESYLNAAESFQEILSSIS